MCCGVMILLLIAHIYICGETSQPLQHDLKQHCRSSFNGNDTAIFKHIIASGHQIDINDITIFDREENWFEIGVIEAVCIKKVYSDTHLHSLIVASFNAKSVKGSEGLVNVVKYQRL